MGMKQVGGLFAGPKYQTRHSWFSVAGRCLLGWVQNLQTGGRHRGLGRGAGVLTSKVRLRKFSQTLL